MKLAFLVVLVAIALLFASACDREPVATAEDCIRLCRAIGQQLVEYKRHGTDGLPDCACDLAPKSSAKLGEVSVFETSDGSLALEPLIRREK